jgi:DNA-binding CsgD family transcriptional regulator/tetratricopeptide (TPR) repeat protein
MQRASERREVRFVRVTAPLGFGKTTLLRATISAAREAGWCALFVSCGNAPQTDPLALLIDLADAAFRELGEEATAYANGLNRALSVLGAGSARAALAPIPGFAAVPPEIVVSRLLEGIGSDRPLLIAIDDADAITTESARAMRYICGYLAELRLAVVCAQRDDVPVHPDLPACSSELTLGPLPREEARAIARAEYPEGPEDVLDAIVERAQGSPADLTFTASQARTDRAISAADVSTTLHARTARDLTLLDDAARTFLQYCALIGAPVEERILSRLYPDPAQLSRLIASVGRTYLVGSAGGFTFRSDLIQAAVRASITLELNLRRNLITVLVSLDGGRIEDHQRIVEHAAAVDDYATWYDYTNRIAEAALGLKHWEQAAAAFATALTLRWPDPDRYVAFFRRYASALRGALRDAEAEAVLLRALRYGTENGPIPGLGRLAATLIAVQTELEDPARAIATYERAISEANDPLDISEILAGIATTYASIVDDARLSEVAARLRAAESATPLAMASLHQSVGLLHARLGRHEPAKAALRTAASFATSQQSGLDYSLPLQELFVDFQHYGCGVLDSAEPRSLAMSRGEELAGYWHYFHLVADLARGSWTAIDTRTAQLNLQRLPLVQQALLLTVPAAVTALSDRRPEPGAPELALLEQASRRGLGFSAFQLAAWVLASRPMPSTFFGELARQVNALRNAPLGIDIICFAPVALALHAVSSDPALAAELADDEIPHCSRWLHAQYMFARGYCRTMLGRSDGTALLDEAAGEFAGLGASYFAELASAAAKGDNRARSARPVTPGRANRRRDGLTARELQIAELVADGKRNREIAQDLFLSERTVEVHLANVFGKLKLNSRVQLARYMRE